MGTFIPKPYKRQQVTIRLNSENLRKVDEYAELFGITRSDFIDQCVTFALANMADLEQNEKPN